MVISPKARSPKREGDTLVETQFEWQLVGDNWLNGNITIFQMILQ